MADSLDQDLVLHQVVDFSAGQWSNPHPTDKILTPENAAAELLDADIDTPGRCDIRRGYTLVADDLGSNKIGGLLGYYPTGGTRYLIMESNGIIYSWNGSDAAWTSRKTGLTPQDQVFFFNGLDGLYRVSRENTIRHTVNGTTWLTLSDSNTYFPRAKFALLASNRRTFAFNTAAYPNGAYYSEAGGADGTDWDRTLSVTLFGKDVEYGVTGAIEFTDGTLIVMNPDEMFGWDISDADPDNWTNSRISQIGSWALGSVAQVGEDALFLSRDGVRSIAQSAQDKKRGVNLPISWPIQDWIDRINWAYAYKAQAAVWADKYLLAVPIDSATENSHVLCWSRRAFEANGKRGGWTIWRNWHVNCWGIQAFGNIPKLYFGESQSDSKVYFARSSDTSANPTSDNGTAITLSLTPMRSDFDSAHLDKSFETVEARVLTQSSGTIALESQIDGSGFEDIASFSQQSGGPTLPVTLPFTLSDVSIVKKKYSLESLGRGRDIQHRLSMATLDADCSILSIGTSAFVEEFELNED